MGLHGQARPSARGTGTGGYSLAVLLVAMAVMAVLMTAAMPVWRHMVQREKEAELVFRGQQYARAIGLFQRKFAGAYPPNLDVLVEQRFLRRKYKDPMTKDGEFQVLLQNSPAAQQAGAPQQAPGIVGTRVAPAPASSRTPTAGPSGFGGAGARDTVGPQGGVIGVTSKSKDPSIMLYNGRSHYNEWVFVYTAAVAQPGAMPGTQRPGQMPQAPGTRPGPAMAPPGGGMPGSRPGSPFQPAPRPPGAF